MLSLSIQISLHCTVAEFANAIWVISDNDISACAYALLYGWNISLQTLHSWFQNTQSWIFQQKCLDDTLDIHTHTHTQYEEPRILLHPNTDINRIPSLAPVGDFQHYEADIMHRMSQSWGNWCLDSVSVDQSPAHKHIYIEWQIWACHQLRAASPTGTQ